MNNVSGTGLRRIVEVIAPARLGCSFRWLLGSSWVSNLGDGLALAAGPLLVASQTRDPFLVALAVMLQRLPWLLFGLIAGVVADRFDRRRLIVTVQMARACVVAGLSATILLGQINTAVVLVAMFLLGTAEAFVDITGTTLLPMIVEKRDLGIGNARLLTGTITINHLAGPPVGAALFAAHTAAPFLVQLACLLISGGAISRVVLPAHGVERAARSHVRQDIADGLRWMWRNAAVRTLVITIVTFNITFGAAWSVLVLYAIERLRTGEVGFGLLSTATAVGGLLGTAIYGWLASRVTLGNLMRAGLIIETLTHLALALTTTPWVALLIMFVFGAHAFVWNTTSTTVRQRAVPTELQGRVSSVYLIGVHGGIVVGSVIGGVIAGAWGVVAPFWFAFIGSALLVVVMWRQLTHIAHADEAHLDGGTSPAGAQSDQEFVSNVGQALGVRRCEECGFDWDTAAAELIAEIDRWPRAYRAGLTRLLEGEDSDVLVRTRPAPQVWSALEYTVHMRDVASFYLDRVERVLAEDHPTLSAANFASMADERRYNEEDVEDALTGLADLATCASNLFKSLDGKQWDRVGVGSEGGERTVLVLARRLAHDGHHHLLDLGRVLRAVRESMTRKAEA